MTGSSRASPDHDAGQESEIGPVGIAASDRSRRTVSGSTSSSDTAGPSQPSEGSPATAAAASKKEKGRVRFNSSAASPPKLTPSLSPIPPPSPPLPPPPPQQQQQQPPLQPLQPSQSDSSQPSPPDPAVLKLAPAPASRPSILRGSSSSSIPTVSTAVHDDPPSLAESERQEARSAAAAAQERARQMAANVQLSSSSSRGSQDSYDSVPATGDATGATIPLRSMPSPQTGKSAVDGERLHAHQAALNDEAFKIVRAHTWRPDRPDPNPGQSSRHQDADVAKATDHLLQDLQEINDGQYDGVYSVPAPAQYRGGVLSQLLKLYKPADLDEHFGSVGGHANRISAASFMTLEEPPPDASSIPDASSATTAANSGSATPTTPKKKWYETARSQETLVNLIEASARLANPKTEGQPETKEGRFAGKKTPQKHKRNASNSRLNAYLQRQAEEEAKITIHIAETLSRQEYIITLCRALMLFGAPTHRLEEYLATTAKVLEIDGQFLYLPGCMIVSFDDRSTHTTEVRIVRAAQGIDLGKLRDTHHVYKEVIHDVVSVDEGIQRLDALIRARDKFHAWVRVVVFGLTSATAAPFSFGARLIDLPFCFFFGCIVGFLQLIVAANSTLYSNVLEVTATVLVSFLARAFGSIQNGELFCFSAMAQAGIVMLLPGYLVLCSALELQSRAIVPGSIRIVYAIIYSLFLGFGITIGAVLYGMFDSNAVSTTSCAESIPEYDKFIFVPFFVLCISILYQAKWQQMPAMLVVAFAGYVVNYFSSIRFSAAPQVANTLGALTVGVLANLYSRLRHGVAAATLIPAIFTQVPGGLASTGGLLSGLRTANALTNSSQSVNGTSAVQYSDSQSLDTVVFNVAASMIQIAIGIAVGLFISALIIYPLGKRRSGLFSF